MKAFLIFLTLISETTFANSAASKKICDSLLDKAISNCQVSMCEDWLRDEGKPITKENIDDCLTNSDGDLMEGASICAADGGEFDSLVAAYNRKHPKNKINCDDN